MKKLTRRHLLGLIAGGATIAIARTLMGAKAVEVYAITFPPDADPARMAAVIQRVKDDGRKFYEYDGMRIFRVRDSQTMEPTGEHIAYVIL